ncbi:zinc finger miz domain-containing protein 1-like protein [Lasius niger]|uniref:Zinc finger miz domain-containing protein 1-like protein n=1 Tax=Lasius niger TaxID=67767 RepID=A0A0J7K9D9_LASNI|nr:zinc finger miz domain-containing protein 1-like protein [Lasius niger]
MLCFQEEWPSFGHGTIGHVANGHVANGHKILHTVQLDTVHLDTARFWDRCSIRYTYVSDFRYVLQHCKHNLYADDLQVYLHCKPKEISDAILRVNEDINAIIDWSSANNFILNPDKTQAIIMGTSRCINALELHSLPRIKVDTAEIEYSSSVKYLGVVVSRLLLEKSSD